jgi:hypothetical protein
MGAVLHTGLWRIALQKSGSDRYTVGGTGHGPLVTCLTGSVGKKNGEPKRLSTDASWAETRRNCYAL